MNQNTVPTPSDIEVSYTYRPAPRLVTRDALSNRNCEVTEVIVTVCIGDDNEAIVSERKAYGHLLTAKGVRSERSSGGIKSVEFEVLAPYVADAKARFTTLFTR
jgi:hypothetical protein